MKKRFFWKKFSLVLIIALYLAVGAAVGGLYYLQRQYADRVYPGVRVAGYNFAGLTWEEADRRTEALVDMLSQTNLAIQVEGGEAFTPTLEEIGVNFDKDKLLANIFSVGRGKGLQDSAWRVLATLFGEQTIKLSPILDRTLLKRYVEQSTSSLSRETKNAGLVVNKGVVEITPSQIGRQADPAELERAIMRGLTNFLTKDDRPRLPTILLSVAEATPAIMEKDLEQTKEVAQTLINDPLTMEFEAKKYTFTSVDIGSWMIFKEDGKNIDPEFDDAKISTSVSAKIARFIDLKMVPKKILITTGQVMDEGRDGRSLDRTKLLNEIKALLTRQTRTPITLATTVTPRTELQVYPEFTLGLYDGRYIEVNLSKQMMYAIEGQQVVASYLISSGKEWGGYATPTGTMYIKNKISLAYSRKYVLWMPYWNGLSWNQDGSGYEGYGIHELPCFNRSCTSREGIGHLGTPVSHGCIRLGHNGPAAFIYDWAPVGTPVYIHK